MINVFQIDTRLVVGDEGGKIGQNCEAKADVGENVEQKTAWYNFCGRGFHSAAHAHMQSRTAKSLGQFFTCAREERPIRMWAYAKKADMALTASCKTSLKYSLTHCCDRTNMYSNMRMADFRFLGRLTTDL